MSGICVVYLTAFIHFLLPEMTFYTQVYVLKCSLTLSFNVLMSSILSVPLIYRVLRKQLIISLNVRVVFYCCCCCCLFLLFLLFLIGTTHNTNLHQIYIFLLFDQVLAETAVFVFIYLPKVNYFFSFIFKFFYFIISLTATKCCTHITPDLFYFSLFYCLFDRDKHLIK